ncbi:hypothetical protein [Streptomyces sp. NPDC049879]|uniref:hypothetical protein n=1 Tax=Streptomyces sp. NPDC049879 TaxID=3365598 RepID=UPI0037B55522
MGACLEPLAEADPWVVEVRRESFHLNAIHVHDDGAAPTGEPGHVALAAGREHDALDTATTWPSRTLNVPRGDAPRIVVALDQAARHPAYGAWREAGGELTDQFVVEADEEGDSVRITGPMWCSVNVHPEDDLDPGDPAYTHTGTEIAYADLGGLRARLVKVGAQVE